MKANLRCTGAARAGLCLLSLLLLPVPTALGEAAYPTKSVRMIVGFEPGGRHGHFVAYRCREKD